MIRSRVPTCFFYFPSCQRSSVLNCARALLVAVAMGPLATLQGDAHFQRFKLQVPDQGRPGFTLLDPNQTGMTFTNQLAKDRSLRNQVYLNGAGVAAGDVDGDQQCDLYFAGLDSPNRLYRNLGGWRFEDITAEAGVACQDQASTGVALADLDGDRDLDLLVNGIGKGTRLFLNDGTGRFTETTAESGLKTDKGAMSFALADVEGDEDLDLYVVNYRTETIRDQLRTQFSAKRINGELKIIKVNGRPVSEPDLQGRFVIDPDAGVLEQGEEDYFYLNNGDGTFEWIPWSQSRFLNETGKAIETPYDWGLSAMFRDLNRDQLPDLYVCNDFQSPDRIWINQGNGTFQAIDALAIRQTSLFSMGVDFADLDRDGYDEIFVADMLSRKHRYRLVQRGPQPPDPQLDVPAHRPQSPRNTLFFNRGDGTYAEIAQRAGIDASDWSWCPAFLDVDLDGYEDLLITTGHERDSQNQDVAAEIEILKRRYKLTQREYLQLRRKFPSLETVNYAFRNLGGLRFEERGQEWGFDSPNISQGMCLADLDADGDQDVVVNCLNGTPLVYRNEIAVPRVAVSLQGRSSNTRGVGARIRMWGGAVPLQSQEITAGGRYLSCDQARRVFAAGSSNASLSIEVQWTGGHTSWVHEVAPNHLYQIQEPDPNSDAQAFPPPEKFPFKSGFASNRESPFLNESGSHPPVPHFVEVNDLLDHIHRDRGFDDYQRQPLLPRKLSGLGPGVAWSDLDGDGWEDLIIGSGRGGRMAVYRNDKGNRFLIWDHAEMNAVRTRDQTGILAGQIEGESAIVVAGRSNYEDGLAVGAAVEIFYPTEPDKKPVPLLEEVASTVGPLAAGDADGDGDLDLFVGGRVLPGRYPAPASSFFLRNEGGSWKRDRAVEESFEEMGLVSGARWSDINQDQRLELILACEWGPIRIFQFQENQPVELTADLGLLGYTGWWTSVQAGDFNNDGKMDLVAGNWGENTFYQSFIKDHPVEIYFGDVNGEDHLELLEAYYVPELSKVVPRRDWGELKRSIPFIAQEFSSYEEFSRTGMRELLRDRKGQFQKHQVRTLTSMIFLNTGAGFTAHPLPMEAQLAPIFGIVVGDFDGDGNEDIFLVQNFFGVSPDRSRQDGGRGVWLRGDGQGGFATIPGGVSGIEIFGQGRGVATADFNHDGRLDLVVAQNGGRTRLFQNRGAAKGLRVELKGPPSNPRGVGAKLQLLFPGEQAGPMREIYLGGGYWSQDAFVPVLGGKTDAKTLKVIWPDGKSQQIPLNKDQETVQVP